MAPSSLDRVSSPSPNSEACLPNRMSRTVTKMFRGMSLLRLLPEMKTGLIMAVTPRISSTLNMLDPTMLPIEMSALPFRAPTVLTASSGIDVPIPTTVRPIRNSLRPALRAMAEEPSTIHSAPKMSRARLPRRIII